MQRSHWDMALCRYLIAGAAAVVMVTTTAPVAVAQGHDNGPDAQLMRYLLDKLGLKRDDEPTIDYRERSPLVVPPDSSLPPPETTALAKRYPNWPVDPEEVARKKRKEQERRRDAQPDWERDRVLLPSELGGRRVGQSRGPVSNEEAGTLLSPSALGYVGGFFTSWFGSDKPESKPFRGEPPRTVLTDPPPGYQIPASGQPYGIGIEPVGRVEGPDPYDPTEGRPAGR